MYIPVEESALSWSMTGSRKVLIVGFERPNHNPASSKFLLKNLTKVLCLYTAKCLHTYEVGGPNQVHIKLYTCTYRNFGGNSFIANQIG